MKPETKFYGNVKKNITQISWIRIENLSVPGTPDLLGYNTKTNIITFSPHLIAFHVKHPRNTFILVLDARDMIPKLYEGKDIRKLAACGLVLEAWCSGYESCSKVFESLGA